MSADDLDAFDETSFLDTSSGRASPERTGSSALLDTPEAPLGFASDSETEVGLDTPASPAAPPAALFSRDSLLSDLADELAGDDAPIPSAHGLDDRLERISNFFQVPAEVESIIWLGYLVCLDSLLYIFTILPLRVVRHMGRSAGNLLSRSKPASLLPQQRSDLIKVAIIGIVSRLLFEIDTSVVYHSVRGQSVVKLYVIFNVLEILDKLCSSFGNEILDTLYLNSTSTTRSRAGIVFNAWWRFSIACIYVWIHSLVFFYQCTTLQVAINSYNNALLTLLLSNQFVEVKGSVFKKYERENMFQLVCADIVERFQLSVFLVMVGFRNYLELSGAGESTDQSAKAAWNFLDVIRAIPEAFSNFSGQSLPLLAKVVWPLGLIMGSEVLVDWLKHAFVTKFNAMEPTKLYRTFGDKLAHEIVSDPNHNRRSAEGGRSQVLVDHGPSLSKRMGFSVLPLVCLLIRMGVQIAHFLGLFNFEASVEDASTYGITLQHAKSATIFFAVWIALLLIKLRLSRGLLIYARERMAGREEKTPPLRYPDAHVFPAPLRKHVSE